MSGRKRQPGTPYRPRVSSPARPRKLTREQVKEMAARSEAGEKLKTLCPDFGVGEAPARRELGVRKGANRRPLKLAPDQIHKAEKEFRVKRTHPEDLAQKYGVSHSTMKRYLKLATDSHTR